MTTTSADAATYSFYGSTCPICGDSIVVGSPFDALLFPNGERCALCAHEIITGHMYKPSVYQFQDSVMSATNRFFGVELEYEYRDVSLPVSTPTGYGIGRSLVTLLGDKGEQLTSIPSTYKAAKVLSSSDLALYAALRNLLDRDESMRFVDTIPLWELSSLYDDYIYFKHDGSLHNGVELVTHPTTYIRMFEVGWGDIFKKLEQHNYHALTSCGLHIHVTRNSLPLSVGATYSTLANLIVLTQVVYWRAICDLFNRSTSQADRFAASLDVNFNDLKSIAPKQLIDRQMRAHHRYSAVNLTNDSTVEFRIFPSTLEENKFFAALELVDMFCTIAREYSYKKLLKLLDGICSFESLQQFAEQYQKYYLLSLMKGKW